MDIFGGHSSGSNIFLGDRFCSQISPLPTTCGFILLLCEIIKRKCKITTPSILALKPEFYYLKKKNNKKQTYFSSHNIKHQANMGTAQSGLSRLSGSPHTLLYLTQLFSHQGLTYGP